MSAVTTKAWFVIPVLGCGYVMMTFLVATLPSGSTAITPAAPELAEGVEIWRSAGCIACHSIYGLGGHVGPDLTNAVSRLNEEAVAAKILAGSDKMPRFVLSDDTTAKLVAWLSYIDHTGVYPLPGRLSPGYGDLR